MIRLRLGYALHGRRPPIAQFPGNVSPFRINTCKSVSKQRTLTGSVDILVDVGVPQAVEVISQAEQQGLADLRSQATARSAGGEFALDHRKDGFDLRALSIALLRKLPVHLSTQNSFGNPPARLRRDNALRSPALPNMLVVGFGIKLGIGKHQAQRNVLGGRVHQSRKRPRVDPRPLPRPLRQQDLLMHIGDYQPLQIVFIARLPTAVLLDAPEEVGADGLWRQSRAIHGGRNSPAPSPLTQPPHRFSQPARDGVLLQPAQEAIQRGVVRHDLQVQNFPQVAMLAQTYFGFAKGPVFVAHQTKDGQQLWLRELVFAETAAVGRQNRGGHIQSHAGKGQESDLWHPTSCLSRKPHPARFVRTEIALCAEDVNRATLTPFRINTYKKHRGGGAKTIGDSHLLAWFVLALYQLLISRPPRQPPFPCRQLQRFLSVQLGLPDQLLHSVGEALRSIRVQSARICIRRAHQQGDFASRRHPRQRLRQFRELAAPELFMKFGDFARQARRPVAQNLLRVGNTLRHPMRRFVQDDGALLDAQVFQRATPFRAARRQKSHKQKLLVRQSRSRQRRQQRRRTRDRHHRNLVPHAKRHQPVTRIRHQRHPRIADQRDPDAVLQLDQQLRGARHFVVLVIADQRFLYVVVVQQFLCVPRIFARDEVHFFEDAQRA